MAFSNKHAKVKTPEVTTFVIEYSSCYYQMVKFLHVLVAE